MGWLCVYKQNCFFSEKGVERWMYPGRALDNSSIRSLSAFFSFFLFLFLFLFPALFPPFSLPHFLPSLSPASYPYVLAVVMAVVASATKKGGSVPLAAVVHFWNETGAQ